MEPLTSPVEIDRLRAACARLRLGQLSRNTLASYADDFQVFERWCGSVPREALPGPLFTQACRPHGRLGPDAIRSAVIQALGKIGLEPKGYSTHSLRAGFITAAGEAGVNHLLIAAQTGHRSLATLQRYFRRIGLFRANAAGALGL